MEEQLDSRRFCIETRWYDGWILIPVWGIYWMAVIAQDARQLLWLVLATLLTGALIYELFHKIEIRDDQILVTKWGRLREQYSLEDVTKLQFYPGKRGRFGRTGALKIYVGNEPVVWISGQHRLCNPIFQYIRRRRPDVWISLDSNEDF